jgi:hypothetical protein
MSQDTQVQKHPTSTLLAQQRSQNRTDISHYSPVCLPHWSASSLQQLLINESFLRREADVSKTAGYANDVYILAFRVSEWKRKYEAS